MPNTSYTPTSTISTFLDAGHNLSKINDGDRNIAAYFFATAGDNFEITLTYGSAFVLELIKLRGGPSDANGARPEQIKVYRGTSSGVLLKTFTPTYTFDNYSIVNTTDDTVYTLVVTASAKDYTSIQEIETWGDPPPVDIPDPPDPPAPTPTVCYRIPEGAIPSKSHGYIPPAIILDDCCFAITPPGCFEQSGTTATDISEFAFDFAVRGIPYDVTTGSLDGAVDAMVSFSVHFVDMSTLVEGLASGSFMLNWTTATFRSALGISDTGPYAIANLAEGLRKMLVTQANGSSSNFTSAGSDGTPADDFRGSGTGPTVDAAFADAVSNFARIGSGGQDNQRADINGSDGAYIAELEAQTGYGVFGVSPLATGFSYDATLTFWGAAFADAGTFDSEGSPYIAENLYYHLDDQNFSVDNDTSGEFIYSKVIGSTAPPPNRPAGGAGFARFGYNNTGHFGQLLGSINWNLRCPP